MAVLKLRKLACILFICLLFPLSASGKIESWSTIGSEYTHFVGPQNDTFYDVIQDEFGLYLGYSCFVNDNSIGFYSRNIIQVPIKGEMRFWDNSAEFIVDIGATDSNTIILGRIMVGPIYRNSISQKNDFYFSIGPELRLFEIFSQSNMEHSEYVYSLGLGIGVDIGCKHNFNKISFFQIGLNVDYQSPVSPGGGTNFVISPYVGIGLVY